eukprot:598161-Rhodomonas_salina.1
MHSQATSGPEAYGRRRRKLGRWTVGGNWEGRLSEAELVWTGRQDRMITGEVGDVLVEGHTLLGSAGLAARERDREDRVGAELGFVGGAVELLHAETHPPRAPPRMVNGNDAARYKIGMSEEEESSRRVVGTGVERGGAYDHLVVDGLLLNRVHAGERRADDRLHVLDSLENALAEVALVIAIPVIRKSARMMTRQCHAMSGKQDKHA